MTPLRVAVAQIEASADAVDNIATAVAAVQAGADGGARLVLLPEYTLAWAPRLAPELGERHAELAAALAAAAAERDVWVVVGTLQPSGTERLRNTTLVLGPDGAVHGSYTKVHLFDAFGVRESDVLDAGEPTAVVVDVDGWKVGLATCYDLRFPEIFRALVDGGAQVLAVGAAWADGPGKATQLEVLARARALENTSYLLLASQTGRGRVGGSAVVDPLGEPAVRAGQDPTVLLADLSPDEVAAVRERVPALQHRRYAVVPRTR